MSVANQVPISVGGTGADATSSGTKLGSATWGGWLNWPQERRSYTEPHPSTRSYPPDRAGCAYQGGSRTAAPSRASPRRRSASYRLRGGRHAWLVDGCTAPRLLVQTTDNIQVQVLGSGQSGSAHPGKPKRQNYPRDRASCPISRRRRRAWRCRPTSGRLATWLSRVCDGLRVAVAAAPPTRALRRDAPRDDRELRARGARGAWEHPTCACAARR